MKKTQRATWKQQLQKGLLQWPRQAVPEFQRANIYHPWDLGNVKGSLGRRTFRKGIWGWRKGRLFCELHEAVSGEGKKAREPCQGLWCGYRAERKWLSQPAIKAAVVRPMVTAQRWHGMQDAGCPFPPPIPLNTVRISGHRQFSEALARIRPANSL